MPKLSSRISSSLSALKPSGKSGKRRGKSPSGDGTPPRREPGQRGTDDARSVRHEEMGLSHQLKWSVIIHSVLFAVILVKSLILPEEVPKYVPALRVDLVGLPDILKKDLEKVRTQDSKGTAETTEASKPVEPEKPAPDEMALKQPEKRPVPPKKRPEKRPEKKEPDVQKITEKKREQKRAKQIQSALSRIKALDRIDKIRDSMGEKAADSQPIKGNTVSQGSTLTGDARENSETGYFDSIREQLKTHWELPVWVARQRLSAQVQIFLGPEGRVIRMVFLKPSGNSQFDEAVRSAIKRSEPFPSPPDRFRATLMVSGLKLGFPL